MARFGETLDYIAAALSRSVFRKSLDGYCRLVTAEDNDTLVADDGSLVSVFALEGFRSLAGETEVSQTVEQLRRTITPYFASPGCALQFWFGHSPHLGASEIDMALSSIGRVAHDSGLDVEDLIDERRRILPRKLTGERSYLAVWSRPSNLTKNEIKVGQAARRKNLSGAPSMRQSQWPDAALEALRTRHRSVSDALLREFALVGIEMERLDARTAITAARGVLYPEFLHASPSWSPVLPGDMMRKKMPSTNAELKKGDISNLTWPALSRQLLTESATIVDQSTVEIGNSVFSGFDLSLPPEIVVSFNDLVRRVLDSKDRISWRTSMLTEAGGYQGQIFKEQYARLFTWTAPSRNRRIVQAFDALREADGIDDTAVRFRVSFAAWAPKTHKDVLMRQVANLRRAVERWGSAQTDALIGDPVENVMSSALAMNCASTAPPMAASLSHALAMSPISRPAKCWDHGAVLFRTSDGKLWPYQPGSSKQTSWVDVIVGTPGSGKSVLLNSMNLGVALSPQSGQSDDGSGLLPRISIIDVGPSSAGLISLLRDSLPANRRHEVVYHRLRMEAQYSVNPFDTQLALRFPLAHERGYLVNLVTLLCTPDGAESAYDGISALAASCINEAYERFSDDREPKKYVPSESYEVDAALGEIGYVADQSSTWWEVTDVLMEKGRRHEAALAQRFAVPTLSDLILVSNSETVREPFREMVTRTQEPVLKAFQRMVSSATKDFPILARPTRFDVSGARIIAFDLSDVTATVGPQAKRHTAIMYMLAHHAVTSDFWLDEDELRGLKAPQVYIDYHLRRWKNNRQMHKRLCFDEYHMTGGLGIRQQVINDVRVCRKAGVQIALASQLMDDFDEAIQKLVTNIWFCNVPTESAISEVSETYNLSASARSILRTLHGPVPGEGAPVMAYLTLKSGVYTQYLINELGPIELWALSTTSEDTALRSMLYDRLGSKRARAILAARFPDGSAKATIERRLGELEDRGVAVDEGKRGDVIRDLADQIVKEAVA
ncbi:hypothetical protein [Martelella sp. FOR1707]